MDPVIIVKKNNKNNKQDNYNKKRVWLGENLKKKNCKHVFRKL